MSLLEQNEEKKNYKGFKDIIEIAHFLSTSTTPEKIIEIVITKLCERLGKRARCAFLEGDELTLKFWAGKHACPLNGIHVNKNSIVWETVKKGEPVNLIEQSQSRGYSHTLGEPVKIKAIIPLSYVDPITQNENKIGALIVDSGEEEKPISNEEFEYLQLIGHLLSAIIGRAQLIKQLMASCQWQEKILLETAHNFRNRIVVIGGIARRIGRLLKDSELSEKASQLLKEVEHLEKHLADFEAYTTKKEM